MTEPAIRRRRRRQRRRLVLAGAAGIAVLAAAGSAWALGGTDAPSYRLATAATGDVEQTVDVDGTLAARDTATMSFAVAGTVASVGVAVGDTVTAGQRLATIDPARLKAAVDTAKSTLADAQERLAADQEAQLNGTASTATSPADTGGGASTNSVSTVRLTSAVTPVRTTPTPAASSTVPAAGSSDATAAVRSAQRALVSAQRALDTAVAAQDAAVDDLVRSCAAGAETEPDTSSVQAGADGSVGGTAGAAPLAVTIRTVSGELAPTTSANPQRIAAGAAWTFAGLTAGTTYRVETVRTASIDTAACGAAVTAVGAAQQDVDTAAGRLDTAVSALSTAVGDLHGATTGSGSGGGSGSGSGSGTTGSAGGSGAGGGSTGRTSAPTSGTAAAPNASGTAGGSSTGSAGAATSGTTVTAEQLAADVKKIDAARAELAVARQAVGRAVLTSSIAGTVAAVSIADGDTVPASSSTSVVTVVGTGALSATVDVALADIDLVKVGQPVAVTVDGRTAPLAARVSFIGTTNSSSSTGAAASYPVTVVLDRAVAGLFDGMGAGLAIDVGGADNVLTVPISAVHSQGTRSTVDVWSGGTVTSTPVRLGLVGADRVQVSSGITAGTEVVLAEVSAAVPSSGDTRTGRTGLTGGLTGGTGGGPGGMPPGR